jgi:hypothetical protein
MSGMLGKLFTSPRGTVALNTAALVVGIILVIAVESPRIGTIVFLAVTALESGLFVLIYGLRSQWHREPAARAVFWAVTAYFTIAAHLLTMYIWSVRWWWTDDLRELLYLGLAVAGLNLVLTVVRVLRQGPSVSA